MLQKKKVELEGSVRKYNNQLELENGEIDHIIKRYKAYREGIEESNKLIESIDESIMVLEKVDNREIIKKTENDLSHDCKKGSKEGKHELHAKCNWKQCNCSCQ